MNERIKHIVEIAFFIALCAVSAIITIPFGPVPFTLQTFAFTLVLYWMMPKLAFATLLLYIVMGGLGCPVFSGMKGGVGSLIGPTGGFLMGYVLSIFPLGVLKEFICEKVTNKTLLQALQIVLGFCMTFIAYCFGCVQYSFVAGVGIEVAFFVAVLPFLVVDALKIVLAYFVFKVSNEKKQVQKLED